MRIPAEKRRIFIGSIGRAVQSFCRILRNSREASLALLGAVAIVAASATTPLVGCSSTDITDPDQVVFPDSNVSYHLQVQPYMSLSCGVTGCHDASRPGNPGNGGVDLSSWVGIRANNVTQPGDSTSELILVMYGRLPHSAQFRANDNQRRGIRQWVLEGAKNN